MRAFPASGLVESLILRDNPSRIFGFDIQPTRPLIIIVTPIVILQ